jgi:hypothetical protein
MPPTAAENSKHDKHDNKQRPPSKKEKKDERRKEDQEHETDVRMAAAASASRKRPVESDSDGGLAGGVVTPPAQEPVSENMLAKYFEDLNKKIVEMQGKTDSHFDTMHKSFTLSIKAVSDRVEANEDASRLKFDSIQADLALLHERLKAPPPAPAPAAAASSSGGTAAAFTIHTPRPTQSGPAEDCLVFIRGFPVTQPGFVLKEYATEALAILPTDDRAGIRLRISPADTQFSMVFPTPEQAKNFVEIYRGLAFVFRSHGKPDIPLTCRTGKPIALRRRGGLIRPVYAALEEVLNNMPTMKNATISQTSRMRGGSMTTHFYALRDRELVPLFHMVFAETPEEMHINEFQESPGCPLDDSDLEKIRHAALGA